MTTAIKHFFVRYHIDACREINGIIHSACEEVDVDWHDTEEEAVECATALLADDDELILTVGEYSIEAPADAEPSRWDWARLITRAPDREIEVR